MKQKVIFCFSRLKLRFPRFSMPIFRVEWILQGICEYRIPRHTVRLC